MKQDQPAVIQQTEIDCHAQISISAGPDGLVINLAAVSDEANPAVTFARWVCENADTLMAMQRPQQIIASAVPRLLGPDGRMVS